MNEVQTSGQPRLAGTSGDGPVPPLLKQGQLQQAAWGHVQLDVEYLQGRRCYNLSGQPLLAFKQPLSKDIVPMFKWHFPCLGLCPLPLVLALGTTEKSRAL